MITHTVDANQPWLANPGNTTIGALKMQIQFRGKSAHAGAWASEGVNALKAATLAMTAMDLQRETFRDEDNVRIHWTITKGGQAVSAVLDDVQLDMMVRARRVEAMLDAAAKVDRALRAGALALGSTVYITTMSGVLPMEIDPNLRELFRSNQIALLGPTRVGPPGHSIAGTDVGDLAHIMPVCRPVATGVADAPHTEFYHVTDHVVAAANPAKFMAMTVVDLLCDGAVEARRILDEAKPSKITKVEFLALRRAQDTHEVFDGADGR